VATPFISRFVLKFIPVDAIFQRQNFILSSKTKAISKDIFSVIFLLTLSGNFDTIALLLTFRI